MTDRATNFDRLVEDYDERQLPKVLDFKQHRFISVERDSVSGATFVQGHKTLRGACGHLSRAVEGCERFIPVRVVDLDTGEQHELDVFAFVAPKHLDAVAAMMPRALLRLVDEGLRSCDDPDLKERLEPAFKLIERTLERRST